MFQKNRVGACKRDGFALDSSPEDGSPLTSAPILWPREVEAGVTGTLPQRGLYSAALCLAGCVALSSEQPFSLLTSQGMNVLSGLSL